MAPWPPQVQDLKHELRIDPADTRDDARLQRNLDAAVSDVEREREGEFDFAGTGVAVAPATTPPPTPTPDLVLGTLRLASRFYARSRSPDGMADLGELGAVRVPGTDLDIDRLL